MRDRGRIYGACLTHSPQFVRGGHRNASSVHEAAHAYCPLLRGVRGRWQLGMLERVWPLVHPSRRRRYIQRTGCSSVPLC
eukprot:scaffold77211_cov79-Phaeocystis_antarctica.AAC.2